MPKQAKKVYYLIAESTVGHAAFPEVLKAQRGAFETLSKLVQGTSITEEEQACFPQSLDVQPYPAIGILPGEMVLASLIINNGDNLLDILHDYQDIRAIYKRLTRKLRGELLEARSEYEAVEEEDHLSNAGSLTDE